MTLAGINIDIPATMKEIRQTGFPIVLVGFIGLGGHHWASRYFDEVLVPESRSKIAMIEGVQATNVANAKQIERIADILDRQRKLAAWIDPLMDRLAAAAEVVDGAQGQGNDGQKPAVEENAARFDFGEEHCP
jgi:pyridoxine 5'-phosphate synthase PdxJ